VGFGGSVTTTAAAHQRCVVVTLEKTMKTFTVILYTDPSHGWAKVKKNVLANLGIASDITPYSYQRGDYAYLEEDCDLSLLCKRLAEHDTKIKFVQRHTNKQSRIRGYERYAS
jgi:hypothetical protein